MPEALLGLTTEELCLLAENAGQPSYRGKQIAEWLYSRGARSWEDMSNLPAKFRAWLDARFAVGRSHKALAQTASDGTLKLLLEMADGATVETVGLPYVGHAANDQLRRYLMPGMTRWPVAELIEACREHVRLTGRRVTLKYCLLDGLNDGETEARQLVRILRGLNCHVNLIPFNNVAGPCLRPSTPKRINTFRDVLSRAGIRVTRRVQRGAAIDAACGQLRRRETLSA